MAKAVNACEVVVMPAVNDSAEADAQVERRLHELVRSWGLSRFSERVAMQWLQRSLSSSDLKCDGGDMLRLRKWVLMQLNHQRRAEGSSHWQTGCPEVIPLLRAAPVWDCRLLPWVRTLEDNFSVIKEELLSLRGKAVFQPYRAPTWASPINVSIRSHCWIEQQHPDLSLLYVMQAEDGLGSAGHDAGNWNVFYLFLHNMDFRANRQLCPRTAAIIEAIGGHYDHAFFSALAPRSHVAKHHGPTNKKLRCHLPLVVPPPKTAGGDASCRLRIGGETIHVREGKCFVFDDSFEHEAWNDDPERSRVVLIVDVWHPDLSAAERKFLAFLRNAQLRSDKQRCEAAGGGDNFYHIIQQAHEKSSDNQSKSDPSKWSQQPAIWS